MRLTVVYGNVEMKLSKMNYW